MNKSPRWSTMFEDSSGGFSSMRIMFVFTTVAVIVTWIVACFLTTPVTLLTIPKEAVGLILGFGGVKAFQRFAENGTPETEEKSLDKPTET